MNHTQVRSRKMIHIFIARALGAILTWWANTISFSRDWYLPPPSLIILNLHQEAYLLFPKKHFVEHKREEKPKTTRCATLHQLSDGWKRNAWNETLISSFVSELPIVYQHTSNAAIFNWRLRFERSKYYAIQLKNAAVCRRQTWVFYAWKKKNIRDLFRRRQGEDY